MPQRQLFIPVVGGEINRLTSEQMVKRNPTSQVSLWLINVWPCGLGLNDVPLCQRGLLKLGYPSLLR